MTISIIAAVSRNRVIGLENRLPWKLPEDLRRFKRLTMGHHLILGRKTFDSIGRLLPGREMVVVTRQPALDLKGVQVVHSVEEALELSSTDDEVFIGGGEQIYRQTLARADRLYLTHVHGNFEGDAFFPEFEAEEWRVEEDEVYPESDVSPGYSFVTYGRR